MGCKRLTYQEKDPETGKLAFQLRLYDSRINRWLTPDPYGQYFSPYMSMGNNWVMRVDPDGGEDDWVFDPDTGEYYWDEKVTFNDRSAMVVGHKYIGANISSVYSHFDTNLSNWNRIKRAIGGNVRANVDFGSYVAAKVTPRLEEAIIRQAFSFKEYLNADPNDDFLDSKKFFSYINLDLEQLGGSGNSIFFKSELNILGERIPFNGEYVKTNRDVRWTNFITHYKTYSTAFGIFYKNALFFQRGTNARNPQVILQIQNDQSFEQIVNFITSKN